MAASYPASAAIFPARTDGQTVFAAHVNALQDEVAAIEAGLLTGGLQHALWGAQALTLSGVLSPPTLTVDQHNYAPAGLSSAFLLRLQLGVAVKITGLLAQPSGRTICLVSFGGGTLTLANLNAGSAAANQIVCPGIVDLALGNGCAAWLWYDVVNSFWRVVATATPTAASGGAVTYIGAKVYSNALQAIGIGAYTTVTFQVAEFNYGPCWAAGAPTRLTIPAGQGGVYYVYGKSNLSVNANMRARFLKNGAVISTEVRDNANPGACYDHAFLLLNAGDYVEFQAYSGAAGNLSSTSARDDASEFGCFRQNPV